MRFHYVYVLHSERQRDRFYVGQTEDLKNRLAAHNRGDCASTAALRPWRVKTAIAFNDPEKARVFERYLKSGSGRAFARKHL